VKAFFDSLQHIDHIQTLVDACERESEGLEYKKASEPFTDTNEISKDVSAFANSSGGVIIYGVSTDRQDKTKPALIEGVHAKNRETFDRVVNSRIQPPIPGLQIKMIPQDSPRVMVVYVPQSDGAPHQNAGDHKYYRRAGIESLPMPHDLVALYFGRRSGPLLSLRFDPLNRLRDFGGDPAISNPWEIRVFMENSGKRVAKYVKAIVFMPIEPVPHFKVTLGTHQRLDDLYPGQHALQFAENVGVIYPGLSTHMFTFKLRVTHDYAENQLQDPFLRWQIFCDEMEAKEGVLSLADLRALSPPGPDR
jgi:hypothetical protein